MPCQREKAPQAAPSQSRAVGRTIGESTTQYTGAKITIALPNAEIRDFLQILADAGKLNLVMDPDVQGTLGLRFTDTPWDQVLDVVLKKNDRYLETFYNDRWYNVFEIYDRDDAHLKGWYCNVGRPAVLGDGTVSYVDLAIDLWVSPDGRQTVLDQDEFDALELEPAERASALLGLAQLQQLFESKRPPH